MGDGDREIERQTDREIERQTDREIERQTDTHIHREIQRHRDTERERQRVRINRYIFKVTKEKRIEKKRRKPQEIERSKENE